MMANNKKRNKWGRRRLLKVRKKVKMKDWSKIRMK